MGLITFWEYTMSNFQFSIFHLPFIDNLPIEKFLNKWTMVDGGWKICNL